ncbi:hypothetical protein GGR52DRAFT_370243 [Hypoxylon sp. FL1284]|nr:hypothetical protein GGR52DRAFT_370243 [Hypoxylon sp. FL1284]
MCLLLFIHNTTPEHETRLFSVVNPDTGYAVYNPFQDPYASPPCDYPHIFEQIARHEACPWHSGCCRLSQRLVCRQKGETCQVRVKYHHFSFADEDANEILSFLNVYYKGSQVLLQLASRFFEAGTELALANYHRNKVSESLSMADYGNRADLAAKFDQLSHSVSHAAQRFSNLARLWDLNTGPKALPPRPGTLLEPM